MQRVFGAHPIVGSIDHNALSREFVQRFPNIRGVLTQMESSTENDPLYEMFYPIWNALEHDHHIVKFMIFQTQLPQARELAARFEYSLKYTISGSIGNGLDCELVFEKEIPK